MPLGNGCEEVELDVPIFVVELPAAFEELSVIVGGLTDVVMETCCGVINDFDTEVLTVG